MKDVGKELFSNEALENWYSNYHKFEAYKEKHGHCDIAVTAEVDEGLARWVDIQRNLKNRLPPELKKKLTAINFEFEEKGNLWERMYKQMAAFVQKHGHAYPPPGDQKYEALRDWLIRQTLDKKFLSDSQFQRLDLLGVDWNIASTREHKWGQMFLKLKAFHTSYGHSRVPQTWAEDKQLANWVSVQRRAYAANKLNKGRQRMLGELDFVWNVKDVYDTQWEQYYEQLASFYKAHGHCRVPGKHGKLASWVERQRTCKTNNLMLAGRERRLNEIKFIWGFKEIKENNWYERYRQLCGYRKKNGHSFVPVNYKKNKRLGLWVATQRKLEAGNKLGKNKKKKLDHVGFVWATDTQSKMKSVYEETWNANWEKLKAYNEAHGTCQVSLKIDPALQRWASLQRNLYLQGSLSEGRIEKLNKIGFPWSIKEGYWMKMFMALTNFSNQFGHTRVPFLWAPNPPLAAWVYRTKLNKAELGPQKVKLLNSIGFDWALSHKTVVAWEGMYGRLVQFKQEHGHTRVPVKWAKDPKLGKWVSRMRHEKSNLPQGRKSLLEAIEFNWGHQGNK